MRQEASDSKFVEWSKWRSIESWDTQAIAEFTEKNGLLTGLDIGGGIGTFANAICDLNKNIEFIDIIDPSVDAHENFVNHPKTNLLKTTFELMPQKRSYDFITINLVCHHIIDETNKSTIERQLALLKKARSLLSEKGFLFVEENIYESYFSPDS
ncbi:MAG: hypothetical protein COA41_19305 [Sphingopyxis sp.]|nr:MAG: hypothetical protein COA41_19305 [Sphingopyxis sp.]